MKRTMTDLIDYLCTKYGSQYGPTPPDVVLPITARDLADILEYVGAIDRGIRGYLLIELDTACPTCQSVAGMHCRTDPGPRGTWLPSPHRARIEAAQKSI